MCGSDSTGLSIYSKNGNVKIEDVVFINGTVTGVNSVDVQGIDDGSTLLNMVGSLNQHGRIFQIQSTPGMLQPDELLFVVHHEFVSSLQIVI